MKSIRSQMFVTLFVGVILLFGFLGLVVDSELDKLPDHLMLQYQEIVNARVDEVGIELLTFVEEVKMISQSTIVQSMDMEEIKRFLPSLVIHGKHRNLTISNVEGVAWTTMGNVIDITEQEQYKMIIEQGKPYWISQPFISPFADPDMPIVIIAHEVRNSGELVGLVNIVLELHFLTDVVKNISLGESGYSWIINDKGKIIVHPELTPGEDKYVTDYISETATLDHLFKETELRWIDHFNSSGDNMFTFYKDIENSPGWKLLLSINTSEVLGEIYNVRLKVLAGFIIGLMAVIIFVRIFSNRITKPILNLKQVFEEAEAGNAEVIADESVPNEIGAAAKSFNKMLTNIRTLTYFDSLTKLYNFNGFLVEYPYQAKKLKEEYPLIAVVVVSIDDFKKINSIHGYENSNLILRNFAQRLANSIDLNERIGRYFGDEFILLIKSDTIEKLKYRIRQLWMESTKKVMIKNIEVRMKVSIGVSIVQSKDHIPEVLINEANIAKTYAKNAGGNQLQYYDDAINETLNIEQRIENALFYALENNEFYLVYQPIVDIQTNKIVGTEALLRWKKQELYQVSPAKIIEVAERSGLILEIGRWVLYEACKQNVSWQKAGYDPMFISVNISVIQLEQPNFVEIVEEVLNETNMNPNHLELEITETTAMTMVSDKFTKMKKLKNKGINIAIDDFGTGYSSLAYLTKFPISTLKIDRSFVKDITSTESEKTIVMTIISMAKAIGIETTAEGVEFLDQLEFLQSQNCDRIQGYLISKPTLAEELEKLF